MNLLARSFLFSLSTLLTASLLACAGSNNMAVDFTTPEGTFNAIQKAVEEEDLALYTDCFTTEAIERGEAMLSFYEENPVKFWTELHGIFKRPQAITISERTDTGARGNVSAPEADGGGIGGIRFEKVASEWKISAW